MNSEVEELLSSKQVKKLIGHPSRIITYPELSKYQSLDKVFGGKNHIILLYVNSNDNGNIVGHWCLIVKNKVNGKKRYEFLDPYGLMPDDQLKFYSDSWREQSGQVEPVLTKLLYDASLKPSTEIHYNQYPLQAKKDGVNTCGRWIGIRGRYYQIPLEEYQEIFRKVKKEGYNLDKIVTNVTESII